MNIQTHVSYRIFSNVPTKSHTLILATIHNFHSIRLSISSPPPAAVAVAASAVATSVSLLIFAVAAATAAATACLQNESAYPLQLQQLLLGYKQNPRIAPATALQTVSTPTPAATSISESPTCQ